MPEPCLETQDRGCVPESDYEALAAGIAGKHAIGESFRNQWGLGAIGADPAYANLELRLGGDARPGEGVVVGILDTGIDRSHPAFENTTDLRADTPGREGRRREPILARHIRGQHHRRAGAPRSRHGRIGHRMGRRPRRLRDLARLRGRDLQAPADRSPGFERGVFCRRLRRDRRVASPVRAHRFPEPEPGHPGNRREIQRRGPSRAHGAAGRGHGPGGLGGKARLRLGRGKQQWQRVRPGAARVPERRGGGEFRVPCCPAWRRASRNCSPKRWPSSPSAGTARSPASPTGAASPRTTAWPPRRGGHVGLFRSISGEGRGPGHRSSSGHIRRRAHGDRRSRPDEAALPRPALQYGPGRASHGNGRPERRLCRCGDLRAGAHGPGRREVAALLRETGLQLGAAFGDGLVASLASREIAAFDSLGAPFWYDFGGLSTADAGPLLSERLREFQRVSLAGPSGSPADALHVPLLGSLDDAYGALPALHLTQSGASAAANASYFALAERGLVAAVLGGGRPDRQRAHHGRHGRAAARERRGACMARARHRVRSSRRLAGRAAFPARYRARGRLREASGAARRSPASNRARIWAGGASAATRRWV